jgi:hypothetical protein
MEVKVNYMQKKSKFLVILFVLFVISACSKEETSNFTYEAIDDSNVIDHIHGIGYPANGDILLVATHHGPITFDGDTWKQANSQRHDYMGFQAVSQGFYSSGHPEPDSTLEDPIGLVKSVDLGENIEQLAFYGEVDFHYLAAGYATNRVYVINPMPVKGLEAGLHYTDDDGETFVHRAMNGFDSEKASNLAAHPEVKDLVMIGSESGLSVSTNAGEDFSSELIGSYVTYVTVGKEVGYVARIEKEKVELVEFDLDNYEESLLSLPEIEGDNPITFIAPHPMNEQELSIVTLQNDIYVTKDSGKSWIAIIEKGKVVKP